MHQLLEQVEQADIPATLGAFIRQAAERYGTQTAGVWFEEDVSLSYAQLDEQADRLASSLVRKGVRKGTHVAVMLGNTPAYMVTWVALARIGAVIVPVNTAYRLNDLHFVLEDSDAQFFIVAQAHLAVFREIEEKLSLLAPHNVIVQGGDPACGQHWEALLRDGEISFVPPSAVGRDDLLNIQYTSGTTGFPKGCMLSHDYWLWLTEFAAVSHLAPGTVRNVLVWQPFFYMDGMWLFLLALRLGGCAYIAQKMHLSAFYDWIERYQIHHCIFPEAALKARAPSAQDARLPLQYASIYGWSHASRQAFRQRFTALAREGYGMTEIGLALLVPNAAETHAMDKTCGLPGPGRQFRIVTEDQREARDGETGELLVSGRALLWGYYKRPDENAHLFDGGWFRTGDIFYRSSEGFYYLVGRSKDMIKRSGENIAAREVEATLCQMDGIAEAAVLGVPDARRGEEVKAYILLCDGVTPEECPPDAIVAHCARLLAAFKVPRYISYVSEFPRTPSRKIRKPELREQEAEHPLPTYDRLQVPAQG